MKKKNKPARGLQPSGQTMKAPGVGGNPAPLTRPGWSLIAAGALCVLLGFLALTRVDPMARNAFATWSPLLILGGYALVGLGLALPAPGEGGETPSSPPPAAR